MKTLSIICIYILITISSNAQTWQWANAAHNSGTAQGNSIAVDAMGNTFICGTFENTLTLENSNLTSLGRTDAFVAKYDPSGQLLWVRQIGSDTLDEGRSVDVDDSGNCYIVGNYSNTIMLGSVTLTCEGWRDIFIVKYDAVGNVVWAQSAGGSYGSLVHHVTTDHSGHFLITGMFNDWGNAQDTSYFGNIMLHSIGNSGDIFLAKYDNNTGACIWAKAAGNSGSSDYGLKIAIDIQDNIFLSGNFSDNGYIRFDTIQLFSNSGGSGYTIGNMFVAKYDSAGNAQWAKSAGGHLNSTGSGGDISYGWLAIDSRGNSYVTGWYGHCSMKFTDNLLLPYDTGENAFIASYNSTGQLRWAKSIGGVFHENGRDVAVDQNDNVYFTGYFSSITIIGNDTISQPGTLDQIYIARYDTSGNLNYSYGVGGTGGEQPWAMTVDVSGSLYLTGIFGGSMQLGPFSYTSAGNTDVFIGKLSLPTTGISTIHPVAALDGLLYPNPVSGDYVFINTIEQNWQKASIFNQVGQLVSSQQNNGSNSISVKNLPRGIYYLQLTNKGFSKYMQFSRL